MIADFYDSLSNFLRASLLLFHSITFWYIFRWRAKLEPNIDRYPLIYYFTALFLNFILNLLVFFRDFLSDFYIYMAGLNISLIGVIIFYAYKIRLKYNFYYLLVPCLLLLLQGFYNIDKFLFAGLFFIGLSFLHVWYKEKFASVKPSHLVSELIRKRAILPYIFFGFYLLSFSVYLLTNISFFNFLSTFMVFLSLSFRMMLLYEDRFKYYIAYLLVFTFIFSVLIYSGERYIENKKEISLNNKKIFLELLNGKIQDKITFYSRFIKIVSSSPELKYNLNKGYSFLNNYLTLLNQQLNIDLIYFIDTKGIVKACSAEYRDVMMNKDLSSRSYFKSALNSKSSVFIGRGLYTKRDDIRISHPVYDRGKIIGLVVFQFKLGEDFIKYILLENVFVMHRSGAVLIGKEELRNRLIYTSKPEELEEIFKEKIFGNESNLLPLGFRQIDIDIFEDNKKEKWQMVKREILPNWYMASFVNISVYKNYKSYMYIGLFILVLIAHSFAVRSFERLRNVFIRLAEEVEEKRVSFDGMDTGVIYKDTSGKIKHMNKEAERILRLSEEECRGKYLHEIFSLKEYENSQYKILQVQEKEIPVIYTENPVIVKGVKFGDVITLKDATDLIQRQEFLNKIERMRVITRISAGIVHDFNNYLMILTGNLSLLREIEKEDKNRQLIERMLEATKLMGNIIQELKDLSPDFISKKEKIDVVEIAKKSLEFLLGKTNIKFNLNIEEPVSMIYADSGQVYRIFQNLIVNAKQAMGEEGEINVKIKEIINDGQIGGVTKGKFVFISISDTGPGIPKEHLDKIFEPFFTMKKEGKGLGLSIVKSIIEKLGGKIEAESEEGRGTTFTIYLPVSE